MGMETNRSTSSALRPFQSVTIIICVLVTSGKASKGVFKKLKTPAMHNKIVIANTSILFFNEKVMMPLMNLFIKTWNKINNWN
jgi:hypothetical protein